MQFSGWDPSKHRGYGNLDGQLADNLEKATSKEQADQIARDDGHQDAADAVDWLVTRTR